MVTAGTRNNSSQGRKSSMGRRDAALYSSTSRKKSSAFTPVNTTSRMYATGWSNSAFSSRRAMVRIGLTSGLRLAGQLMEQVLEAPGDLVQLVQRPAAGLGESVDLGPQIGRAIGAEGQRHPPIRGGARSHVAHAGEPAQCLGDTGAGGLDRDLDRALPDEPVHRSVGHDLAAVDDEQTRAGVLDLGEHVRRQDHRAVLAERAE